MGDWRANALAALTDARSMVLEAAEPTYLAVVVVGETDLLEQRPVSFCANMTMESLGPLLVYSGARIVEKNGGEDEEAIRDVFRQALGVL